MNHKIDSGIPIPRGAQVHRIISELSYIHKSENERSTRRHAVYKPDGDKRRVWRIR